MKKNITKGSAQRLKIVCCASEKIDSLFSTIIISAFKHRRTSMIDTIHKTNVPFAEKVAIRYLCRSFGARLYHKWPMNFTPFV